MKGRSEWKGPDQEHAASEGTGREVDLLPGVLVLVWPDVMDSDTSQNSFLCLSKLPVEDDLFRKPS